MAMRKSSCKNTPQYLRSCCSPIGQNNTKDFSAQSGGSIGRAVWKWSGKSRFPGPFSALLVNLRRFISLPDLFPLALTNRPWVSEDASILVFLEIIPLQCLHVILCFYLRYHGRWIFKKNAKNLFFAVQIEKTEKNNKQKEWRKKLFYFLR